MPAPKKITRQEAFDKAYRGVIRQRRLSIDEDGACVYRGPNNSKCGIGHLIPNSIYSDTIEFTPIAQVLASYNYVTGRCEQSTDPVAVWFQTHFNLTVPAVGKAGASRSEDYFSRQSDYPFLEALQQAHDKAYDDGINEDWSDQKKAFVTNMRNVAKRFKLSTAVMQKELSNG